MLQIKNTLGGGKPEGLYVWKKSQFVQKVVSNPTLSAYVSKASSPFTLVLSSSDFDVYKIAANDLDGFVKDDGVNKLKVVDGQLKYGNDTVGYNNANYDNSTATITVNTTTAWSGTLTFSYSGEKTFSYSDVGDLINYVVSDKETAYPDGGEKGGYWYERVVEFDVSALGITNFEIGSFTLTSGYSYNRVNHSLGILPKAAILFGDDRPKKMAEIFTDISSGGILLIDDNGNVQSSTYDAKATTTTVTFHTISSSYAFKAGVEYRYAIFA